MPELDGIDIPHAGVYTLFTTNGHLDEFVRFVTPDTVVLAEETVPRGPARTPVEKALRWLQEQNHERLERVYDILSRETTEAGEPIRVARIPMPVLVLEVFEPGDGTYDYYAAYDRWEDGSTLPGVMLAVWPASYVNYVPTNDLVLVSKFWKPGRPLEMQAEGRGGARRPGRAVPRPRDRAGVLGERQPGRRRDELHHPAAAGEREVRPEVRLGEGPGRGGGRHPVRRADRRGGTGHRPPARRRVYLKRLSASGDRVRVEVVGASRLDGRIGWVDEDDIESAGEKCPAVYSLN